MKLFSNTLQTFLNAAAPVDQDRIIRKEVALGTIRDIEPPKEHLGVRLFAPWLEVASDDVIFNYVQGETDGLAPARAEDAESELAQKDDLVLGEGRASLIDWSLKDHYDASDVTRYREYLRIMNQLQGGNFPLTIQSHLEDWATKFARDTARRRRKLDNRINWLIMKSIADAQVTYSDQKIQFTVPWGRPNAQQAGHADNDLGSFVTNGVVDWSGVSHDPIGFIEAVKEFMYDEHGITIDRVVTSKKVIRRIVNSDKFSQRAGLGFAVNASGTGVAPDLNYLMDGWGPDAAVRVVENATDVKFIVDDSVYRTRPVGSKTITNNRFFPEDRMVFLPSTESVNLVDDTEIGFGRTLTSPHPEGGFTPGFYEWEKSTKDPWGQDAGTGVKAFPVFPHMDFTYAVNVLL